MIIMNMVLREFLYRKNTIKDSVIDLGLSLLKRIIVYDSDEVLLASLFNNPKRFITDIGPIIHSALVASGVDDVDLDTLIEFIETVAIA